MLYIYSHIYMYIYIHDVTCIYLNITWHPLESLRPLHPRTELNKSSSVFKIMRKGTVVELEKVRREILRLSCGGEKVNVPVLGM